MRASDPPEKGPQIHELEGWVSDLWQTWCRFCRRVVVESSVGCVSSAGVLVGATHPSVAHVSHVASKQKKGLPPAVPGTNSVLRIEPTWGHVDKLLEVIQALSPGNSATLLAAFGTVPDVEHVRVIRNASAHLNAQTFAEVIALQPNYLSSPIAHPLHALTWTDRASGKALVQARMDDMRIAARNACM